MTGTLFGVGVGPGDPELMTLKAVRVLKECPVVAYPAPLEGESMARSIAASHISEKRAEIAIRLPFTSERGDSDARYDAAAEDMAAHLNEGRDIAMLCLGDPLFYGTFAYIMTRLAGRFPVTVIPGVTSLAASSAASGLALCMKDESLCVIPATLEADEIASRIESADCAAIVKLGRHLGKVRDVIAAQGLTHSAHYVAFASGKLQQSAPLSKVSDTQSRYFAIVLLRKAPFQ
jgi:precorrin-2/cobalt-factor-2 C20-methyltransferase